MNNMRPGSPAMHGIADNMPPGYEAMIPSNQGMANAYDGAMTGGKTAGGMSKVYAEPQAERASLQSEQLMGKNLEGAAVYAQNEALQGSRQASAMEADKQNKINRGLNQVMADIIETDDRIPSGGAHLEELSRQMSGDGGVEFKRRIAAGRSIGMG